MVYSARKCSYCQGLNTGWACTHCSSCMDSRALATAFSSDPAVCCCTPAGNTCLFAASGSPTMHNPTNRLCRGGRASTQLPVDFTPSASQMQVAPASQLHGTCQSTLPHLSVDLTPLLRSYLVAGCKLCLSSAWHSSQLTSSASQRYLICQSASPRLQGNYTSSSGSLSVGHLPVLPVTSTSSLPVKCKSYLQAVKAVAEHVERHQVSTLVVDPVLVATSGDSLAGSEVAQALKTHLFPLATLITPNLPEASALLGGRRVDDLDSMKQVGDLLVVLPLAHLSCNVELYSRTVGASQLSVSEVCAEPGRSRGACAYYGILKELWFCGTSRDRLQCHTRRRC